MTLPNDEEEWDRLRRERIDNHMLDTLPEPTCQVRVLNMLRQKLHIRENIKREKQTARILAGNIQRGDIANA